MTLPTGALSMQQIANELGLSLPLSIQHPWVIALAGKSAVPISFGDLRGKTGQFQGAVTALPNVTTIHFPTNTPLFGGTLSALVNDLNANNLSLQFSATPFWTGNIKVTNQTNGISVVLTKLDTIQWAVSPAVPNLVPQGSTCQYLIQPA